MARLPRYVLPGQPQHVIQRGNNRQSGRQIRTKTRMGLAVRLYPLHKTTRPQATGRAAEPPRWYGESRP